MSVSDVLSICCPASKETVDLINKDTILIGEQVRMKITKKLDSINNWPIIDSFIFPEIEVLSYSKIDTNNFIMLESNPAIVETSFKKSFFRTFFAYFFNYQL